MQAVYYPKGTFQSAIQMSNGYSIVQRFYLKNAPSGLMSNDLEPSLLTHYYNKMIKARKTAPKSRGHLSSIKRRNRLIPGHFRAK